MDRPGVNWRNGIPSSAGPGLIAQGPYQHLLFLSPFAARRKLRGAPPELTGPVEPARRPTLRALPRKCLAAPQRDRQKENGWRYAR